MANFAVAASAETIARGYKLIEAYLRKGEKQEAALVRIFDIAEKEMTRGTHPELEPQLKAVDGTIKTLIKQINGIVSGQDAQIEDVQSRLNAAIEERNAADETAKKATADAKATTRVRSPFAVSFPSRCRCTGSSCQYTRASFRP